MMTPQQISLLRTFDLKMVDLKMVTTNFDSLIRRLLGSTTKTNCTVLERSSLRSQPYKNCLSVEVVGRRRHERYRRRHQKSCAFVNNIWLAWGIVLLFACCAVFPLSLLESSRTYHFASRFPAIRTLQPFATKTESANKDARNTRSDMCEGKHLSSQTVTSFLCNNKHDPAAVAARREP